MLHVKVKLTHVTGEGCNLTYLRDVGRKSHPKVMPLRDGRAIVGRFRSHTAQKKEIRDPCIKYTETYYVTTSAQNLPILLAMFI